MAKRTTTFDYGRKAAELEETIAKLQAPDIQIDEATKLHVAGLKLVDELEAYLNQAEITVKKRMMDSE
jgi:exodeoxyribonuclease VII small subunit